MNWWIFILLLLGCYEVAHGVKIWYLKAAKVDDPMLLGGLIGYLVARDAEVTGVAARCVGGLHIFLGLALVLLGGAGIWIRADVHRQNRSNAAAVIKVTERKLEPPSTPIQVPAPKPVPVTPTPTVDKESESGLPKGMRRR